MIFTGKSVDNLTEINSKSSSWFSSLRRPGKRNNNKKKICKIVQEKETKSAWDLTEISKVCFLSFCL